MNLNAELDHHESDHHKWLNSLMNEEIPKVRLQNRGKPSQKIEQHAGCQPKGGSRTFTV